MRIRRVLVILGLMMAVLGQATAAWAHSEFDPGTVEVGSTPALNLNVENEQSDAGTTGVQLIFPDGTPITVAGLPPVAGWTSTVQGGAVGGTATGITWTRPTGSPAENPALPLTLGPLPDSAKRLQFKVLQTYSNGDVERWIEDWPAGAPEPDKPGPVLEVQAADSASTSTTAAADDHEASAPATATADDKGDDSNAVPITIGVIVAVLVIGAIVYLVVRRNRGRPTEEPKP